MKTELPYNLHTHTYRCGHATGEDYEYVECALEAGFKELGFSDHIMLPGLEQEGIRAPYHVLEEYLSSLGLVKEKYAPRIPIHIGFEAEWYGERYRDYYRYLLERKDVEYLILGQHCFVNKKEKLTWYGAYPEEERIRHYTDDLIAGMRSGLFLYVAHPDTYARYVPTFGEESVKAVHRIAQAAAELHIPLELNCAPSRAHPEGKLHDTLSYPCLAFWNIASQYDIDVVIGVDAHRPEDFILTDYGYFMDLAKRLNLHLLHASPLTKK